MSEGILLFGEILKDALEQFIAATTLAQGGLNITAEAVQLGGELASAAKTGIQKIIDMFKGDPNRALQQLPGENETFMTLMEDLITELNRTPLDLKKIQDVYARLLSIVSAPPFNSLEWEAYEIEPPCHSDITFIPKKVSKIPDGMELYEIACPTSFTGPDPKAACKKKPCCKRVGTKCGKRRIQRPPKKTCCS